MKAKKFLAIALTLMLVVACFAVGAAADGDTAEVNSLNDLNAALANNAITTIKLTGDITGDPITNPNEQTATITVGMGRTLTLDLNGYKISTALDTNGSTYHLAHVVYVNGGNLTITDTSENKTGELINTNSGSHFCTRVVLVTGNGTLTMNGGTVTATSGEGMRIDNATVELNAGATVQALAGGDNDSAYAWDNSVAAIEVRGKSNVTIAGATVKSSGQNAIYSDQFTDNIIISSGVLYGSKTYGVIGGSAAQFTITITGGYFRNDPSDYLDTTVYAAVQQESGTYNGYYKVVTVEVTPCIVNSFEELETALGNATLQYAVAVTLGADIEITSPVQLLSTSTITIPEGRTLSVTGEGVLLNDGKITNNGTISTSGDGFVTHLLDIEGEGGFAGYPESNAPYTVSTAMDLEWLSWKNSTAAYVTNVVLANDITFPDGVEFDPIGIFVGKFDGCGYKIDNLTLRSTSADLGLFAVLGNSALDTTVKDLTINETLTTKNARCGGLAAKTSGNVHISKVTMNGTMTATGATYYFAPFVGWAYNNGYHIYFGDCTTNMTVTANSGANIGPIIGSTGNGQSFTIGVYNFTNTGTISATGANNSVGYVMGYAYGASAQNPITVEVINYDNTGWIKNNYGTWSEVGTSGNYLSCNSGNVVYSTSKIGTDNTAYYHKYEDIYNTTQPPVAKIGETKYNTLKEAFDKANGTDDTVVILEDISLDSWYQYNYSKLTIDGNGNKITINSMEDNTYFLNADGAGELNVSNLTLDLKRDDVFGVSLKSGSINGVNFIGGLSAVVFDNNTSADSITIDGCTFKNMISADGIRSALYWGFDEDAQVNNVTVKNSTFDTIDRVGIVRSPFTFIGNKVVNTPDKFNLIAAGSVVRGNSFDAVALIRFYDDTTFEYNNLAVNNILFDSEMTGTVDLSGNYWGGSAPKFAENAKATFGKYYTEATNKNATTGANFTLSGLTYTDTYFDGIITEETSVIETAKAGTDVTLEVVTDNGNTPTVTTDDTVVTVTFPITDDTFSAILEEVAAEDNVKALDAGGNGTKTEVTLYLTVEDNTDTSVTPNIENKVADGVVATFDLNLVKKTVVREVNNNIVGDITSTSFDKVDYEGGLAQVQLPFKYYDSSKIYTVYYVDELGKKTQMDAVYADGFFTFYTSHFSTYVVDQQATEEDNVATAFKLTLVPVAGTVDTEDPQYNVVLSSDEAGKYINRFTAAHITFALDEGTDATGNLTYYFNKAEGSAVNVIDEGNDLFLVNLDGTSYSDISGSSIILGTVSFGGYGRAWTFKITDAVVNTTTFDNNIDVVSTIGAGITANTVDDTNANPNTALINPLTIEAPKQDLAINVVFPNTVADNIAAYEAMTVIISGGDLTSDIVIALGNNTGTVNVTNTDGSKGTYTVTYGTADAGVMMNQTAYNVVLNDVLTRNVLYTVTVSGDGYRTAHYNVNMNAATNDGKTLTFWNNVMDANTVIETGKAASAKVTTFLAGDIVKDEQINIYDLSAVVSYFGQTGIETNAASQYAKYDLNRDGKIDSIDVAYVLVSWNN